MKENTKRRSPPIVGVRSASARHSVHRVFSAASVLFGVVFALNPSALGQETLDSGALAFRLIATGSLPETARDLSGLSGKYEDGTPRDQIGGFSAIEYRGHGNRFWVLADRGPSDGAASFSCRLHEIDLNVDATTGKIGVKLHRTLSLLSEDHRPLLGSIPGLAQDRGRPRNSLDPEGLRILSDGSFVISDEYGPSIDLFSSEGVRQRSWDLPSWMALTTEPDLEKAVQGALPNRGLEGLAFTADGASLVAAMQGPLVQDSYHKKKKRYGNYVRLVKMPIDGQGPPQQWLYPLTDPSCGISEILAVDRNRYFVLERDGESRSDAKWKAIYFIDTSDATDVSHQEQLDPKELPAGVSAVRKRMAIDLLNPTFKIPQNFSLEKPEGLSWGKNLPDGRQTLIVCFDNDFKSDQKSLFLAFALEPLVRPPQ